MISKIIAEDKIQAGKMLVMDSDNIVIVAHKGPDGDSIGSSLGLYHFLYAIGKTATVVIPDTIPQFLSWMPGINQIVIFDKEKDFATQTIEKADLIFCLDMNALNRLGKEMCGIVQQADANKILLDHHLHPSDEFDVTISYPTISSNSEIIFRFICRMGYFNEINEACAECIYTGMMTDTGAFTYNSNDFEIYIIIAELIKKGINKDRIYEKVYNAYSENQIRLKSYTFSEKMKIYPKYKTSIIWLSRSELNKYDYKKGDTEGFVNVPLSIQGIIFSIFLKEDDSKIKVSLRSKGKFPVNTIAEEKFSGGGHLNAAGGELYNMTIEEAFKYAESMLSEYENLLLDDNQ